MPAITISGFKEMKRISLKYVSGKYVHHIRMFHHMFHHMQHIEHGKTVSCAIMGYNQDFKTGIEFTEFLSGIN